MSDDQDTPEVSSAPDDTASPAAASADSPASSRSSKADKSEDTIMSVAEVVDRVERKRLAALKKKEVADSKKSVQKDISTALKKGRLAEKKKARTKKKMQIAGAFATLILGYILYGVLFNPFQAGITYGICRVYVETQVRFPKHLKFVGLEDFGENVRVWYTRIDAFGGQRIETARCYYKYDEELGTSVVDKITIDRREEPFNKIESFNRALPVVLQNLPDLTWPGPDSDKNLDNLQVDGTAARQPVL